jgi:four helix bundle protein
MKDFKDLKVWVKAHEVTLAVYQCTRNFPREEIYGLTSQMRRAAASIAANIAEDCGRRSDAELHRFLQLARGSACVLEYHLLLARDLHFMNGADFKRIELGVVEVQRMLTSLAQRLRPPVRERVGIQATHQVEGQARS